MLLDVLGHSGGEGRQALDDVGVLVRDVGLLADVLAQVVELAGDLATLVPAAAGTRWPSPSHPEKRNAWEVSDRKYVQISRL